MNFKAIMSAVWKWLTSPQARRFEAALVVGIYEAIRSATGHA